MHPINIQQSSQLVLTKAPGWTPTVAFGVLAPTENSNLDLRRQTVDLKVRPIHYGLADRVCAHILLCMLAFYVEWQIREAWRELMFADTDQAAKATRDPVAPTTPSASAQHKAASKLLDDEQPSHSFATLIAEMAILVPNTCRTPSTGSYAPTFELLTTGHQHCAKALIQAIQP